MNYCNNVYKISALTASCSIICPNRQIIEDTIIPATCLWLAKFVTECALYPYRHMMCVCVYILCELLFGSNLALRNFCPIMGNYTFIWITNLVDGLHWTDRVTSSQLVDSNRTCCQTDDLQWLMIHCYKDLATVLAVSLSQDRPYGTLYPTAMFHPHSIVRWKLNCSTEPTTTTLVTV